MTTATQKAQILSWLKRGRRIDGLTALDRFGCFRLGARIWELKKDGHRIEREMVKTRSGKRVAQYRLAS